jgi:hypothetical protein
MVMRLTMSLIAALMFAGLLASCNAEESSVRASGEQTYEFFASLRRRLALDIEYSNDRMSSVRDFLMEDVSSWAPVAEQNFRRVVNGHLSRAPSGCKQTTKKPLDKCSAEYLNVLYVYDFVNELRMVMGDEAWWQPANPADDYFTLCRSDPDVGAFLTQLHPDNEGVYALPDAAARYLVANSRATDMFVELVPRLHKRASILHDEV